MSFVEVLQQLHALADRFDALRPRVAPDRRGHHDSLRQRVVARIEQLGMYDPEFDDDTPEALILDAERLIERLVAHLPAGEVETLQLTLLTLDETATVRTVTWDGQRWLLRGGPEDRSTADPFVLRQLMTDDAFGTNDLELWREAHWPDRADTPLHGLRAQLGDGS